MKVKIDRKNFFLKNILINRGLFCIYMLQLKIKFELIVIFRKYVFYELVFDMCVRERERLFFSLSKINF